MFAQGQNPMTLLKLSQLLNGPGETIANWFDDYLSKQHKEPLEVGLTEQYDLLLQDKTIKPYIDTVSLYRHS